ncbi:unnamed protein product [Acanthoscelides obtectus]|uniref:Uncharacterized protein n=1 Tax=Acanthoscelides obtectus TaxID=200917 RepID=A0A9P0JU14_ACAOB|nr:unnamed protein product [Acanthoscelides obtectus]CAK1628079.1 SCAN domain-containing protein 3 [Acanthoscelides obtectus]
MKHISISDNTVKHRITESQIINKVKLSPFFDIVNNCAQLIVYVRYIGGDIIQEDILYSRSLTAGTTYKDIFNSMSNFVEKKMIWIGRGLCTLGAPAMIGLKSSRKKIPQNIATEITPDFELGISIVNYIKSSALNSRLFTFICEDLDSDHKVLLLHTEALWLSKGNMLARLHKMKEV